MLTIHPENIALQRSFQFSSVIWLVSMLFMLAIGVAAGLIDARMFYFVCFIILVVVSFVSNQLINYDARQYIIHVPKDDRPMQIAQSVFVCVTLFSALMGGSFSAERVGDILKIVIRKLKTVIVAFHRNENETRR